MSDAPTMFTAVRWPRLAVGVCLTGALALSIHIALVQWLNITNPTFDSPFPEVLNAAVMTCAAMWLYGCLKAQPCIRSGAMRIFVLFVLLACLNGTIRNAFMTGYCSTTTVLRWFFGALSALRPAVWFAAAAVLTAGACQFRAYWARVAAGAAVALMLVFVVSPGVSMMERTLYAHLSDLMPSAGWCKLPYGVDIMIAAYATTIEPALASFACIALVWRHLPGRPFAQTALFVVLILALKKQLLSSFLYPLFSAGPVLKALASMGQLTLAAGGLGLLTALFWHWAQRRPTAASA